MWKSRWPPALMAWQHVWRKGGANADIAGRITERGVFVIATLAIPDVFLQGRARLRDDPRFQGRLSAALLDHLTRPFTPPLGGTSPDELRALYATHRDGVQSLVQAGATLLVGTDASAVGTPAAHGISIHREIELLTEAGLSPLQVLRAATARTADVFSLPDRGADCCRPARGSRHGPGKSDRRHHRDA